MARQVSQGEAPKHRPALGSTDACSCDREARLPQPRSRPPLSAAPRPSPRGRQGRHPGAAARLRDAHHAWQVGSSSTCAARRLARCWLETPAFLLVVQVRSRAGSLHALPSATDQQSNRQHQRACRRAPRRARLRAPQVHGDLPAVGHAAFPAQPPVHARVAGAHAVHGGRWEGGAAPAGRAILGEDALLMSSCVVWQGV